VEESGIYLKLPESIGRASLDRLTIDFNTTGRTVDEEVSVPTATGAIEGLRLQVPWGDKAQPFMQLEAINLQAFIGPRGNEFFELTGDFAFRTERGALTGLTRNANLAFQVGSNELSVRNATAGLLINPDGGVAFDGSGTPTIRLSGLVEATAQRLRFGWNSTGTVLSEVLSVGELSAPLELAIGTPASPHVVVIAEGFSGSLGQFLKVSGDFAFQRSGSATGGDLTVAVSDANAVYETPAFRMGVIRGNMGLLVRATGGVALSVSGEPVFA
jgi:hypothetical protein